LRKHLRHLLVQSLPSKHHQNWSQSVSGWEKRRVPDANEDGFELGYIELRSWVCFWRGGCSVGDLWCLSCGTLIHWFRGLDNILQRSTLSRKLRLLRRAGFGNTSTNFIRAFCSAPAAGMLLLFRGLFFDSILPPLTASRKVQVAAKPSSGAHLNDANEAPRNRIYQLQHLTR
jgi:hypothetical protein